MRITSFPKALASAALLTGVMLVGNLNGQNCKSSAPTSGDMSTTTASNNLNDDSFQIGCA